MDIHRILEQLSFQHDCHFSTIVIPDQIGDLFLYQIYIFARGRKVKAFSGEFF